MKCPNCGRDVEDGSPFCIHCGSNIETGRRRRKLRFVLMDVEEDRRFKHLMTALVMIVIVVVAAVVIIAQSPQDGDGEPDFGPSADALVIDESNFIEFSGALSDGTIEASLDRSLMRINFTLSDEASEGYRSFTWILRNELTNQSQFVTTEVPHITWPGPSVGTYTLSVECTGQDGSAVYTGTLTYFGDSHVQYTFLHDGIQYSTYANVSLSEYLRYSSADAASHLARTSGTAEDSMSFLVTDGAVAELADNLRLAYTTVNGEPASGSADYAQYVLDFVQQCMTPGPDIYVHSQSVYWAFPAETLYLGMGDSGDLSVLTASILAASGFGTGIASINGHSMTVVSINYDGPDYPPMGYHEVRMYVDNIIFYLCETTESLQIGCVSIAYDYSDGTFMYYGEPAEGWIATVTP